MANRLTMPQIAKSLKSLRTDVNGLKIDIRGIKFDIHGLKTDVGNFKKDVGGLKIDVNGLKIEMVDLRQDVHRFEDNMTGKFFTFQSSVDTYLKRTEAWHDEQVILKSRHDRLSDVLVGKGVVTKEEILL